MNYKSFFYMFLLIVILLFLVMVGKPANALFVLLYFGLLFFFSTFIQGKAANRWIMVLNLVVLCCLLYFKIS